MSAEVRINRRSLIGRTALAGAGLSGMAVALQACGDSDGGAAAGGTKRDFTFNYPQSGGTERFLRVVRNGVEQAARDLGVTVKITATKKFDQVEQGRLVRAAAASNPDGLITGVWDGDIMREPVTAAVDDGIPVVIMNSGSEFVEPFGAMAYVGTDTFKDAVAVGERMKEEGATNALVVNHQVGSLPLDLRIDGFRKGFEGTMRTIGVNGTDPVDARNRIRSALQDSEYDSLVTLGQPSGDPGLQAVEETNTADHLIFGAFDTSPPLLAGVQSGVVDFAYDQQQYLQGYYSVVVLALFNQYGLRPPEQMTLSGGIVEKENVAEVLDLTKQAIR